LGGSGGRAASLGQLCIITLAFIGCLLAVAGAAGRETRAPGSSNLRATLGV
jgi:hypothetical protein